ncbi:MAG: agmatine deiminase family protein [Prevotella sp.]|nr:agmatine deiminase family protein [Prevotella sp.]
MINKKAYRLPAEWEPQSGVQLTWPHAKTDWAPMLSEVTKTYEEMAREIRRREPLLIVGPPSDDTWARDHGFITLLSVESSEFSDNTSNDKTNVTQHLTFNAQLLDFCFNGWGEKFPAQQDNAINRRLYEDGSVKGEYVDHLDFVLEGGSIESDGKGTIFTTSCCLLAPHRNQPLTREQIEERLKEYLYADRVLWIDHGQLTGDDTDGHIDTLVRIAPDDTLLYVGCDDPQDEQYEGLRLMEEQLKTFRTIDGKPYTLKRLPLPRPIYDEEPTSHLSPHTSHLNRLPATYANFLVINGAVLCPTYAQPDLDAEALRIIGEAFPDREIVGIDCRSLIKQHGSLHCCTMQFPIGVLQTP